LTKALCDAAGVRAVAGARQPDAGGEPTRLPGKGTVVSESTVLVDGAWGEGGGQILRTALTLSLVTGRPVFIDNIRAGRSEPGLRPQHLVAVEAARAVSGGRVEGAGIGSSSLRFFPAGARQPDRGAPQPAGGEPPTPQAGARPSPHLGPPPVGEGKGEGRIWAGAAPSIQPGDYHFRIATAGATTLVVETLVPALALAPGDFTVTVTGGTHVPWAPTFEYLARHWAVMLAWLGEVPPLPADGRTRSIGHPSRPAGPLRGRPAGHPGQDAPRGLEVEAKLEQAGFYPRGGGSVRVSVRGAGRPPARGGRGKPLVALERGDFRQAAGVSLASGLPRHIVERQARELERGLRQLGLADARGEVAVEAVEPRAVDPGTAVYVEAEFATGRAAFTALGQRGKPAEQVAREALNELARYLKTEAAFDYHLADQLLVPLALASGESRFTTSAVSEHLLTNAHVIDLFLGPVVEVRGKVGEPGEVRITPAGS